MTTTLDLARDSFRQRAWASARAGFEEAERESPLGCDDLGHLALAAYLDGDNRACVDAWARAHRTALDEDDAELAARCAFWAAFVFMNAGDMAQAGAWLGRAEKLVEALAGDGVAAGLVLLPKAVGWLQSGDYGKAEPRFADAARIGDRTGDADLRTLAALGQGQALVGTGRVEDGPEPARRGDAECHGRRGQPARRRAGLLRGHREPATRSSTSSVPRSGPVRSSSGATPRPGWCLTAGSA